MKYDSKRDIQSYRDTINSVALRLDTNRRWWTNYVFHFTSIRNAANILKSGHLLSRAQVSIRWPEFDDSASPEVMQQTQDQWKDFVRFYFRPRTPTLFHNEGFRPKRSQELGAHCPIPIYFLFDFLSVIGHSEAEFSPRTLARSSAQTCRTADEFTRLPFDKIYHDSWFDQEDKDDIISARQAEVIYPQAINLRSLKLICCRSPAEKDTLRNLLSSQLWDEWKDRIKIVGHQPVYFKKWLYIERVTLEDDAVKLELNLPERSEDYGPFEIRSTVTDDITGEAIEVTKENATIDTGRMRYYGLKKYGIAGYQYRCTINDDLAYLGKHQDRSIPF